MQAVRVEVRAAEARAVVAVDAAVVVEATAVEAARATGQGK